MERADLALLRKGKKRDPIGSLHEPIVGYDNWTPKKRNIRQVQTNFRVFAR